MGVVNSWNEWDPLEEVIVGTARGARELGFEPAFRAYGGQESARGRAIPQALVDEAERQLDDFARVLEGLGIKVRRPEVVDHSAVVKTPDWEADGGHATAC